MKQRPILFSGEMVRALLRENDPKSQTRRIAKLIGNDGIQADHSLCRRVISQVCPYGVVGDLLWVRETFYAWRCKIYTSEGMTEGQEQCVYAADRGTLLNGAKWRPSIFMPRWASRITLEITDVRVQRLQEISEEDAIAEGLHIQIGDTKAGHMWNGPGYHDHVSFDRNGGCRTYHVGMGDGICICHEGRKLALSPARCAYRILWDSINGKTHPWASNPWVWALTFRRIEVQP